MCYINPIIGVSQGDISSQQMVLEPKWYVAKLTKCLESLLLLEWDQSKPKSYTRCLTYIYLQGKLKQDTFWSSILTFVVFI